MSEDDQANQQPDNDRLADAVEKLPNRLARAMRQEGPGVGLLAEIKQSYQAHEDARKAAEAKRRANIALFLAALSALATVTGAIIAALSSL